MNDEYHGYLTEAPVNHLCLCSGYDGVGRGLKRVFPNLRTIAYVEREGFPIANLVAKAEANEMDAAPVFTDVKTFPYDKFRGCVDVLSAGFPCQPFSSAGLRKATDDPRHLYPWIANGITACRARLVLLENVEGIISAKTGDGESVLLYVLKDLEARGYVCSWGVFSASEVGAPHQRKRVFIMARLNSKRLEGSVLRGEGAIKGMGTTELVPDDTSAGTCSNDQGVRQGTGGTRRREGTDRPRFPAPPNERQYEWEEPRVVEYTEGVDRDAPRLSMREEQKNARPRNEGESEHGLPSVEGSEQGSASIAELDGTIDGRTCRVDPIANRIHRLRLLGNGVVPATCERAVRILWNDLYGSTRA